MATTVKAREISWETRLRQHCRPEAYSSYNEVFALPRGGETIGRRGRFLLPLTTVRVPLGSTVHP